MRFVKQIWIGTLLCSTALAAPAALASAAAKNPVAKPGSTESGIASYYHDKYHGRITASGEVFNTWQMTAAHRTLPFGTIVRVTDTASKRTVTVRIVDRGPFIAGRIIDLSRAAARELRMERAGLRQVKMEVLAAAPALARR